MTLWEIDSKIKDVLENGFSIDEETGEVLLPEDLDKLNIAKNEKIENIALYVKNIKAEADAIKVEIDVLKKRAYVRMKKAEKLIKYLDNILGGEKFETARVALSYRSSNSVQIDDDSRIPDQYIKIKTERVPDKVALAKALKTGEAITGCSLVEKQNLQIK